MKKILALLLLVVPLSALAEEKPLRESYLYLEPTVQLVITNQDCQLWKAPKTVQLNLSYAQNMETGDKVFGCFTHEGEIIQIELVDDVTKEFYSYKIEAARFLPRPNL